MEDAGRNWAFTCAICLITLLAACRTTQPTALDRPSTPTRAPLHRIFLLGNTNGSTDEPALQLLSDQLNEAGENSTVIFLGDNAEGLPDSTDADRAGAEHTLRTQLDLLKDFPGRILYIPGEREWHQGPEALARLEAFIETNLDRGNTFLPDGGSPGPVEVELAPDITLVVLDTQWWLQKEGTSQDPSDLLIDLENLLHRHRDDRLLVVGHHPLFSNGEHAGYASLRDHLTPLPVIGSLEPLYRRFMGSPQDISNIRYRIFRQEMLRLFRGRERLVYASAHDHSLQHFENIGIAFTQHFLVSGSAAHQQFVARGRRARFTSSEPGFIMLDYFDDGSARMEVPSPAGHLYSRRLHRPERQLDEPEVAGSLPPAEYRDSTVVAAINPRYDRLRGPFSVLLGRNHRRLWATPVSVPVLDPYYTAGGLHPQRIGGSSMSTTVWLTGGDEKTYILRSIDKEAGRGWTPEMQRTFARQMVQDQVSMLHPFGDLIVPPLAGAAGIFHTRPQLVYVPNDARLGESDNPLAGHLATFDVRPDGDMSDDPALGRAENVISTENMLDEIADDNDHRVDGRAFARARLFDMLIADHDRTTDNFRWAAFEPFQRDSTLKGDARKQGKIYVPVPRDRDMAFLEVDGLFPRLYRLLAEPTWQDFETRYGYIRGLNKKGLPLDRRFTAALSREDWIAEAEYIRHALTDSVIEAAILRWPEPIREQAGPETTRILKARRDRLPEIASRYYGVLAAVCDVVGSNKHERFDVTRRDAETEVVVLKTRKDGEVERELYRRTLRHDETHELRLYGLGGNDRFSIHGDAPGGLRIIAVGGAGDDLFADSCRASGRARFYDIPAGTEVAVTSGARVTLRDDPRVNRYDRSGYMYDLVLPTGSFASNQDDGFLLGAGAVITRHGFRKSPYAIQHRIRGTFATHTQAVSLRYDGRYVDALGDWTLLLSSGVLNSSNIHNFYGLGNETEKELDSDFYRARLGSAYIRTHLERALADGVTLRLGPSFEYVDVRKDPDGVIGTLEPPRGSSLEPGARYAAALGAALDVTTLDHHSNPMQGFEFGTEADLNVDVRDPGLTYGRISSALSLFLSPSLSPQVTFAARVGGALNAGTFPFYAANTLGGRQNLRGFRSTRFSGRSAFFNNLELRTGLFDFSAVYGYGTVGVLGFLDTGRVWTDGERSRSWHHGYGGGIWLHLANTVAITGTVGFSEENRTFTLQTGFQF